MADSKEEKTFLAQLRDAGADYFMARLQLTKVQAFEKIARITSIVFSLFIIALLACFTVLFVGMMLGFLIAELFDSNALGFSAVGVLFVLMLTLLIVKRESFLEKPIAEKIIKELFEEEATNELQIVNNGTDPDDEEKDIKSKV